MNAGNTRDRISRIRGFIQNNDYNAILPELTIIREGISDKTLTDQIVLICSRHYELQERQLFGHEVKSLEIETYLKDVLNITDEAEKFLNTIEVPKTTITLDTFSNETILNILNLFFDKKNKAKELSGEELADALDIKVKLYASIFSEFDKQLETTHKGKLSGVLFDRIISFDQIQKSDYDIIQSVRNNNSYNARDRSLLVSGITLSSINRFSANKIHLLIDFLTDFEEGVWQKALVGIIFSLNRYDNRISLFKDVERRLNELKNLEIVQESILLIETILRYRLFSAKENFLRDPAAFFRRLTSVFGEYLTLTRADFEDLQAVIGTNPTTYEEKLTSKFLDHFKLADLKDRFQEHESIELSVEDFFELFDFKIYLDLYELNPLQLDLSSDLYKNPRNWFIQFEDSEELRSILINDFQSDEVEIIDFINTLEGQIGMSEIDKNSIVINIASFSPEMIQVFFAMARAEEYYNAKEHISPLEISFLKIIRELYRFQQLSVTAQVNIFEDKFSIYRKSLLEKIADKTVSDKITARVCFDQNDFQNSLKILEEIPPAEHDTSIVGLFAMNYIGLENYPKALPYVNELLQKYRKTNVEDMVLVSCVKQAKQLHRELNNEQEYENYLTEETELREAIFNRSIIEDQFNNEKLEKGINLLNCYANIFIYNWNQHRKIVTAFSYMIKYFEALSKIPNTVVGMVKGEVQKWRKDFITLLDILATSDNYTESIQDIQLILEKADHTPIMDNFRIVMKGLTTLYDPVGLAVLSETLTTDALVKNKALNLYNSMDPVFRNIREREPSTIDSVLVPFIIGEEENKFSEQIIFMFENFFEKKDEYVLETLMSNISKARRKALLEQMTCLFLDSIFGSSGLTYQAASDLENLILNDILTANIPIVSDEINTDNNDQPSSNAD